MSDPKEVPDVKIEDIFKFESALDQYTEEEILLWATPAFDELQERKKQMEEHAKQRTE